MERVLLEAVTGISLCSYFSVPSDPASGAITEPKCFSPLVLHKTPTRPDAWLLTSVFKDKVRGD